MKALKWWMWIVGALYLIEGVGLTVLAASAPSRFAETWATATPGSLSDVAIRGTLVAGLPGVLTWVMFGALLFVFSGRPERARTLAMLVVTWELLVWLPLDVIGLVNGFTAGRASGLIAVHLAIGLSGVFALRRSASAIH